MTNQRTPQRLIEAIYRWHTGELTAGTLAHHLGLDPRVLLDMLEANGVCDCTGTLTHPQQSSFTVFVVLFYMVLNIGGRLARLEQTIKECERVSKEAHPKATVKAG